ncbi:MAG: VCBS repeat-containing protein, partial [Myxococcales bacterium]|nr:VCBS repeat-containing protein [Myxococcales bacterium]
MFLRRNGVGVRFAAMYGAISCLFVLVAIVAPAAADDPLPDLTLHYYWDSGLDGARWVTPLIAPGDVNGDGYDDVIVYRQDQKLALAYLGSSEGLSDTNVRAVPIGEKPRTYRWHATGDLNNDGFADMAEIRQLSGGNLEFKMSWGGAEAFAYQEFTIPAPSLADTGLSELK